MFKKIARWLFRPNLSMADVMAIMGVVALAKHHQDPWLLLLWLPAAMLSDLAWFKFQTEGEE